MAASAHPSILKTKLQPPRRSRAILSRAHLTDRIQESLDLAATIVIADAGYGKTTLVSELIAVSGFPACWYQLDPRDGDLIVFLSYLVHGLRQFYPDFGEITLELLQSATSRTISAEQLIDTWLNEVSEKVENKTLIVLDDLHVLDGISTISNALARILTYLPDTLHLIITSRTPPDLNLARLRSKQAICLIERADLAFSEAEAAQLFNEIYQWQLSAEQIREYWQTAAGWITALQLFRQVGQPREGNGATTPTRRQSTQALQHQTLFEIFDYFAEEVFRLETQEVQQRLLEFSLLDWIEPELCSEALNIEKPRELLDKLARRNLFITRRGEPGNETYHLHPLFQAFLQRRLATISPTAIIAQLHHRYAASAARHGQLAQALHHARAGKDFTMVATLLNQYGRALIEQGFFEAFNQAFEHLADNGEIEQATILADRAEIYRLEGNYTQAQQLFAAASQSAERDNDNKARAEALRGLAESAFRQGEIARAIKRAEEALELAEAGDPALRAKCHNILGLCHWGVGALDEAIKEWRHARAESMLAGDTRFAAIISHNLGLPYSLMGQWDEAITCFESLFADRGTPFPQQAIAYLNVGRARLLRGEFALAAENFDHALETCRLFNLRALRGEVLEAIGNLHRDQGDFTRAEDFYQQAERAYIDVNHRLEDKELIDERALLQLMRGHFSAAHDLIERLYQARVMAGNELALASVQLSRARIYLAQEKVAEARADLITAQQIFENFHMYFHQAAALVVSAPARARLGEKEAARGEITRLLGLVAQYGYHYWLQQQQKFSPLLAELLSEPAPIGKTAATTIDSLASEPLKVVRTIVSEPAYDLTVKMFGAVEIYCDENQQPEKYRWSLKQALSIFCFITAQRNHRINKETLIDLFWRDIDPAVIAKNFHPTISYIRKALNSGMIHKRNFLIFAGDAYQLNPEYRYFIDVQVFRDNLAEAAKARAQRDTPGWISLTNAAIALYRGDLLAEMYDEWIDKERAILREQYLGALVQLADYSVAQREWLQAIALFREILDRDNFREEYHCRLMELYQQTGNRAAIKEQYYTLCHLLKAELGVKPLPETTRLYQTLMGK